MDDESRTRLRQNLDAATDETLVALANRGLVRRAAKDLEKSGPYSLEVTQAALLVRGDGWTVTMPPEGPTAATDDTSASGVTRQILAATMYLRDHWEVEQCGPVATAPMRHEAEADRNEVPADSAVQAAVGRLVEASPAELFKWSGKTPLLEASATFQSMGEAKIAHSPQLTVAFPSASVQVVLMTDRPAVTLRSLLDQFKSTAPRAEHPRFVMLAVLALKQAAGKDPRIQHDPGAELAAATGEDRLRVARLARQLLEDVAASGIAHPSTRILQRFHTTAVAAEAARFPRLARLLSGIADDVQLQIDRDAAADPNRLMQRMVIAHALSRAASRADNANRIDLFGRSRTNYAAVGDLKLCGLGAHGWRTASGFEGLTVLFWEPRSKRFLTVSASRGEGQDRTFSIPQAYEGSLGWSGGGSAKQICRSWLTLSDAKVNADGRLSASESCRANLGDATDPGSIDFGNHAIDQWSDLIPIAQQSQPIGLRLPDPRKALVVVRPAHWGNRWFDELHQSLVWELHDESGHMIPIRIPWREVDEPAIAFLEAIHLKRHRPDAILGRLEVFGDALSLYPLSLFCRGTDRGDTVLCPQFDQSRIGSRNESLLRRLRKKYSRQRSVQTRIGDSIGGDDEGRAAVVDDPAELPPLIRTLLLDLDNVLGAALESGAASLHPSARHTVTAARDRFQALGAGPLVEELSLLLADEHSTASRVLSSAYGVQLFRQAARLSRLSS